MLIDPIVETWSDLLVAQAKIVYQTDTSDAEKRKMMESYISGIVTNFHKLCEAQLVRLNTKYLAGERITIVDFVMCSYVANVIFNRAGPFSDVTKAILTTTPHFAAYCDTILREFKEQLDRRPEPTPL